MKYSGIGGQAVMEGIMMKNKDSYAVAVRKTDGSIVVKKEVYENFSDKHAFAKWPMVRGVVAFVDSLKLGMQTLMWSASQVEEEVTEEEKKDVKESAVSEETKEAEKTDEKKSEGLSDTALTVTVILGVVLAVGLFVLLPQLIVTGIGYFVKNSFLIALFEGLIRLAIFVGYVTAISMMPDIKRVYMYHGSEHKCINCVEHGLELTVENVMKSSKEHKRCGTSFLLLVMLISILVFMIVRVDGLLLRLAVRIIMIPFIAGLSYEVLRFNGTHDNWLTKVLSRPGMWLQGLTTKEPTPDMVEVAIAAVEQVFDWKAFLEENFLNDHT